MSTTSTTPESLARAYIRRESLDIYNRLHSIKADVAFVNQVRAAYPSFPLIPNLRCGAWYTDPTIAHPSAHAYFKSTDGHHGNWSFNLRRPNIHLLSIVASHCGLILVDSTRAGKRLPDALSKTVPIWCAVINRAILLRGGCFVDVEKKLPSSLSSSDAATAADTDPATDLDFYTPPGAVSPHEHAQIAARLDSWAASLAVSYVPPYFSAPLLPPSACTQDSSYDLPELARPLRPLWITPASARFPYIAPDASFLPIICVSASRAVDTGTERRMEGFSYVQGSGDDHELWAQGLAPQLFWRHRTELLACSREDLEAVVVKLVAAAQETQQTSGIDGLHAGWSKLPTPVLKVRGRVLLCTLVDLPRELPASIPSTYEPDTDGEVEAAFIAVYASNVTPGDTDKTSPIEPRSGDEETQENTSRVLQMHLPLGKRGHHIFVHDVLPRAVSFASLHLSLGRKLCVAGGDEGVGVAVVLLQLFFDDEGSLRSGITRNPRGTATASGKNSVRTRLEWIIASRPQVNPSRTILKRVNDFLLSSHLNHVTTG